MFRWQDVEDQTIFGMTVKMYRDPFVATDTFKAPEIKRELEHHAHKYLGSELYMYRVMDTNFINYIEERGDLDRLDKILIPRTQDIRSTIY